MNEMGRRTTRAIAMFMCFDSYGRRSYDKGTQSQTDALVCFSQQE